MRLIDADAFAAEMRDRQDAAKAWKQEAKDAESAARADAVLSFLCEVKLTLDKMPTVDAVPVVRCEDCIENCERLPNGEIACDYWCACLPPDFFCAVGKRKEDKND